MTNLIRLSLVLLCIAPACGGDDAPKNANHRPKANAGADQAVPRSATVNLDGSQSSDADGDALSYRWTQISGDAVTLDSTTSSAPSFDAPNADVTLVFSLVVNDKKRDSAPDYVTIAVGNRAPVANAGPDMPSAAFGRTITLDGSASFDADGDSLAYSWSQVAGENVTLSNATQAMATFVAPSTVQTLTFRLTVADGTTSSFDEIVITTAANTAPVAHAGSDISAAKGELVALDGSASTDANGDTLTYAWTQIAGTTVVLSDATAATPTFIAPSVPGNLTFTLVVSDGEASSAADAVVVSVTNNFAPIADAGADFSVQFGSEVSLDGTDSNDAEGAPLTYAWTQTSGPAVVLSGPTTSIPTFTAPSTAASLVFSLVVSDGTTQSAPDSVQVSVIAIAGSRSPDIYDSILEPPSPLFSTQVMKVKQVGSRLYVAGNTSGLGIVDLDPSLASRGSVATTSAQDIAVIGNFAYLADTIGKLRVVSVTDPDSPSVTANPTVTGLGSANYVAAAGTLLSISDSNSTYILNATTPTTPTAVGTTTVTGPHLISGSLLYFHSAHGLDIVSASAGAPTVGSVVIDGDPLDIALDGDYVYLAAGAAGMHVVDVSTPATPQYITTLDLDDCGEVMVSGTHLYIGAYYRIWDVDITNPTAPTVIGSYTTSGDVRGLAVYNGYLFAILNDSIQRFSLTPSATLVASEWYIGTNVDMVVEGNYAYVGLGMAGFSILNLSDPLNPSTTGSLDTSAYVANLTKYGNYIYTVADVGPVIVDVSNPASPTPAAYPSTSIHIGSVFQGTTSFGVYQAVRFGPSTVFSTNHANPLAPTNLDSLLLSGTAYDLAVDNSLVYVATDAGLTVVDASTPSNLTARGNLAGSFKEVEIFDGYAYVIDDLYEITLVDISNPDSPAEIRDESRTPLLASRLLKGPNAVYLTYRSGVASIDANLPGWPVRGSWADTQGANSVGITSDYLFTLTNPSLNTTPNITNDAQITPLRTTAAPSTPLVYTLSWTERYVASDEHIVCEVAAGTCAVGNINQTSHTATLTWTTPSQLGTYELSAAVGNDHYVARTSDLVQVQ